MDEITDHVGALNLTAKEWKPGLGFAPTPKKSAVSAEEGFGNVSSSQAVDVNGTHFFGSGGGASSSWEQDGGGGSGQIIYPQLNQRRRRISHIIPTQRYPLCIITTTNVVIEISNVPNNIVPRH